MEEISTQVLPLVLYPDPRLKKICEPVKGFGQELSHLLDRMAHTMYESGGIGLAAPQVGTSLRVFIVDIRENGAKKRKPLELINPRLVRHRRGGRIAYEEGCLSLPGFTYPVWRTDKLTVEFQDRMGASQELETSGLLSVAIQHENDHLDGIFFLDRIPWWKRWWVRRRAGTVIRRQHP